MMLRRRLSLRGTIAKGIWLKVLMVGLSLAAGGQALAQEGSWSTPVMISSNTVTSWFSDVAVDGWGRPHVIYTSGRAVEDDGSTEEGGMDLLMYSTLADQGWLEPNDIEVAAYGGYTVRPAIVADGAGMLHVTFRGTVAIYYTKALASDAWNASAWTPRRNISGSGAAYYSDIAVDKQGGVHVVWNEGVSAGMDDSWLWLGTPQGGAIYDGRDWRSQEPQAGLGDRAINAIIEDDDGVQWFGTDEGVYRFDGGSWQRLTVQDGLVAQKVNCVAQDTDGALWFGTDEGLGRYSKGKVEENVSRWATFTVGTGLPDNIVHAIAADLESIWVGTEKGLARYDGQNWVSYTTQDGLAADEIMALAVDSHRNVWAATRQGVSRYDGKHWTTYTVESGLPSNVVTAIAAGQGGTIWLGTDRGLCRFDDQTGASYVEGGAGSAVTTLMVDREGTVWAGIEAGVSRYDGRAWEAFELPQELAGQAITAMAEDRRVNAQCPWCADIFYRHSTDGGRIWSTPINLASTFSGSVKPQVRVGSGGDVYVTWEEGEDWYVSQGYPVASIFVHSPDGGNTWMEPVTFSSRWGVPQQITLGVGRDDTLVVVWRLPTEDSSYYYQVSGDKGATWSEPEPIPGVIAKPWGPFSLDGCHAATDGAGNVHLVVLGHLYPVPTQKELGLIHLVWNGSEWSSPNLIYSSKDWPEWPRIDVGVGNRVYASWFTRDEKHIDDTDGARYKTWVSSYQSSAMAVTPVPVPTPTPLAADPGGEETHAATATPTPVIISGDSGLPPGIYTDSDEAGQLVVALSPIVVILLVIAVLRFGRLRRYG